MLLEIKYKNGEIRRIQLHPSFFKSYNTSITQKAKDLADLYGDKAWYIGVSKYNDIVFEHTDRGNYPDDFKYPPTTFNEKQIKRDLRREFKNKPLRKISFEELNKFE